MGTKRRQNYTSSMVAANNVANGGEKRMKSLNGREQHGTNAGDLQRNALTAQQLSKRQQFTAEQSALSFSSMGGCEAQFLEATYLLMHLKQPELYTQMGLTPPKGLLLHGPPGCGKSTFARSIAGELQIPIFCVSSTELVAGVSGESERKIRLLFAEAEQAAPVLVLIDDIDVIAAKRENAQREMERRIVTQLIASLDDLGTNGGDKYVFVVGTTNRPEVLDASLRRAGRFDKELALGIPDQRSRLEILKIATKNMRTTECVNLQQLARLTPGYVGADLFALVQEASTRAVSRTFTEVVDCCDDREKQQNMEDDLQQEIQVLENTRRPTQIADNKAIWKRTTEEIRSELSRAINWLKAPKNVSIENAKELCVSMADFEWALTTVHPSAKREGFATVPDVSWDEIGALQEVRSELKWSILYPIQKPEYFEQFGLLARAQGILLAGPPGCGKTLLAKAVANETGMSFISVKGPELLSMYVGESERAVRTVFQRARDSAPCVIFFDEIDALCPKRSQKETTGSARLVNQLLTEMDGLEIRKQVFLIGATNRPDIVDPAVLRPGRFDKVIFVDFPNATERADILRKNTKNGTRPRISSDVSFEKLAENPALEFFTGADLVALVHEATLIALRQRIEQLDANVEAVGSEHFEEALKRVLPSVKPDDRKRYQRLREKFHQGNYTDEHSMDV